MATLRAALATALRLRRRPPHTLPHSCSLSTSAPAASLPPDTAAPVAAVAAVVDGLHAATGLPWWATIPATAFGVRLALTPLSLLQAHAASSLGPLLVKARAAAAAKGGKQGNGDDDTPALPRPPLAAVVAEAAALARKEGGTHPAWVVAAPLIQIPVFATCVLSVRAMALADWPGFAAGGPVWAPDLTARAVDLASATAPLGLAGGLLPAAVAGLTLASAAAGPGRAAAAAAGTRAGRTAATVALLLEWCALPAACGAMVLPQGAALYWAASTAAALGVGGLVRGRVRAARPPARLPAAAASPLLTAASLRAAGDVAGATAAAEAAVAASPGDARAWFALGQLRGGGRDWRGAQDAYARSAALEPDPGQRARALFGAGVAQHVQGDAEAAADSLARAVEDAARAAGGVDAAAAAAAAARASSSPPPRHVATLARAALARAAALADCGRREEAVAAARVAARLEPGAAAYVSELEKGGA